MPSETFFRFCEEMLQLYRNDLRVGMVSGNNFQFGRRYGEDSYYFSKHTHIWGWASWRNRWQNAYDVDMKTWPMILESGRLINLVLDKKEIGYWKRIFSRMHSGKADTWDFQWTFANWVQGRVSILPSVNLITNIGFMREATHSKLNSKLANMPIEELIFPLIHPEISVRNIHADQNSFWIFQPSIFLRIIKKIQNLINKFMPKQM